MNNHRNEAYIKSFASHFRKLRKSKNLMQKDIEKNTDMVFTTISRIERGKQDISISTLYSLARSIQVHPKELLNFKFEEKDS